MMTTDGLLLFLTRSKLSLRLLTLSSLPKSLEDGGSLKFAESSIAPIAKSDVAVEDAFEGK
jgi:hypothetical protein